VFQLTQANAAAACWYIGVYSATYVLPLIIAQVAEQRLSPALKLLLTHVGG
jgi:hypothetical protein